jgi:hypothetical protein
VCHFLVSLVKKFTIAKSLFSVQLFKVRIYKVLLFSDPLVHNILLPVIHTLTHNNGAPFAYNKSHIVTLSMTNMSSVFSASVRQSTIKTRVSEKDLTFGL